MPSTEHTVSELKRRQAGGPRHVTSLKDYSDSKMLMHSLGWFSIGQWSSSCGTQTCVVLPSMAQIVWGKTRDQAFDQPYRWLEEM